MTYPARASFVSADPFSMWWYYSVGGVQSVCSSTGAAIVRRARAALGLAPSLVWDAQLISALTALDSDPVRAAIWLAYYHATTRPLAGITLPDFVRPTTSVPDDGGMYGGQVVCFDPSTDQPPELLSSAALRNAFAQSSTGLRLGEGRPEPRYDVNVTSPGGGLGTVGVAAIAVVIVGGAWWWSRS